VPETESAWLEVARGKTLRELEMLVASKAPGDAPDAPVVEGPRSRTLRFEVAADTFASFQEAMQTLRRMAGGTLDDDAVLLAMARHVLGGPRNEGRSSYQVALSICSACGGGAQRAGGELVPIDRAIVAMAACDAQHLAEVLPRGSELRAANENASADADEELRARQCPDHAHVGASSQRAKQSIPPAMRRAVLTRDRHRCRVPGCTHATFVDVHHIQPRSEGGRNEASNLLTLCSVHHRAVHRGQLLIGGRGEGATSFRHADGAAYGSPRAPRLVAMHSKLFSALRHLGFREGEVKAVLAELRGDAELEGASIEHQLREALRRIQSTPRR
jgi:hypothetical protein